MDYQTLTRAIFLLLIVALAVYFLHVNKNVTQNIEKFQQQPQQQPVTQKPTPVPVKQEAKAQPQNISEYSLEDKKALIKRVYNKLYKRDPLDDEIKFYLEYIETRNMTEPQFEDVVATTAPILYKTIPQHVIDAKTYGTEDEVILTYNEILGRNPDPQELVMYSKKLQQDKTFNLDKLKQVLISSIEYSRYTKLQTNNVNQTLLGGVTERQINLALNEMYTSITGKELDGETLGFLRKKYADFKFNEGKMAEFIKKFESDAAYCDRTAESDKIAQEMTYNSLVALQQKRAKEEADADKSKSKKDDDKAKTAEKFKDGSNVDSNGKVYNIYNIYPNRDYVNDLADVCMTKESDYELDSQSVFDTINKNASCVFDKNNIRRNKYETMLSGAIEERNSDELKSLCERNRSVFGNPDSEFVLRPDQKWSVPIKRTPVCNPSSSCKVSPLTDQTALIGTLLPDSKKTTIGSILPALPPR